MYFCCYVYEFLLLCVFLYVYCVSLCCSLYCLCVSMYCTTATGCQTNWSEQIYHISYIRSLWSCHMWLRRPPVSYCLSPVFSSEITHVGFMVVGVALTQVFVQTAQCLSGWRSLWYFPSIYLCSDWRNQENLAQDVRSTCRDPNPLMWRVFVRASS